MRAELGDGAQVRVFGSRTDEWVALRQLRNRLIHEYQQSDADLHAALMAAHQGVPALQHAVERRRRAFVRGGGTASGWRRHVAAASVARKRHKHALLRGTLTLTRPSSGEIRVSFPMEAGRADPGPCSKPWTLLERFE